ncbi:glutathione S-transferase family protein [Dasania sp. GY-MA-18]|uniref:Glutathione S-transferase family protein n=1 Tax=Dasania phycosphaerae TaxID=2950436 RepID=A0A9J6RQN1_9GAMM|nr:MULTISPECIES: glutathione S-transferase family protein [Dasania]MCR8924093.1 glutathione S-transferase family protein [Dasania sp. GY-MA-18]MCZ0866666.1 glutathione S-transferase family protein [Dasania phycosphaerae]MCZ0870251.1 glutathione S-transferase family protein [Dasania phycosphaerae]
MAKICLYHYPGACSQVTMVALEIIGLEYDDCVIDIFSGAQKSPEYLKVNPRAKVPALLVNEDLLTENSAMIMYLHSIYPGAKLLPVINSELERARINADLQWCSGTVHPAVRMLRAPQRFSLSEPSGVYNKGVEYVRLILAELNMRLVANSWWYGDVYSMVDVYLHWCYGMALEAGFSLADYPAILRHAERVKLLPGYQRALAREQQAASKAGLELVD